MSTAMTRTGCSSCRFRMPDQGGRVIWQITNRCNYGCCYCIFASGSALREHELDTRSAIGALRDLAAHGFRCLKVTGGEPFCRRDLLPMLRSAIDLGFNVDVSTNASLITRAAAAGLRAAGVQLMHVSLDGDRAEIHDALRGKGTFARTAAGLCRLRDAGVRVRVGCVIWRGNEERLAEMCAYCAGLQAHELILSLLEPAGRLPRETPLLARRAHADLAAEIDELRHSHLGGLSIQHNLPPAAGAAACGGCCPGGARFLYIDACGRISPCTWVAEHYPRFRSKAALADAPLSTLLGSGELTAYRTFLAEREEHGLTGCPIQRG